MQNRQDKKQTKTLLFLKKSADEITTRLKEAKNTLKAFFTRLGEEQDTLIFGRAEEKSSVEVPEGYRIRRRVGVSLLFSLLGFLFSGSEIFFSARPFALALLCASGYAGTVFVYIGALIGTLVSGINVPIFICAYTLTLGARLLFSTHAEPSVSLKAFEENLTMRALIGALGAFLASLGLVIADSFSPQSVFSLLTMTVAVPILVASFRGALGRGQASVVRDLSICVIIFVTVFSLKGHSLFGLSFALIVSAFVTFFTSHENGFLRGALIGMLCGLAVDPALCPVFAILGMCTGAFKVIGSGLSLFIAVLVSGIAGLYSLPFSRFLPLAGNIIFSALIFWALEKSSLLPSMKLFSGVHESLEAKYAEEKRRVSERDRLSAMSESFDALAETFLKISDRHRYPGTYELREVANAVVTKQCKTCPLSNLCWQKEHSETLEALDTLAEKLRGGHTLSRDDIPEKFRKRCRYSDKITAELNLSVAELIERLIKQDKTELFALDYEAMSELLRDAVSENDKEFLQDNALAKRASEILGERGVRASAYGAWGTRKKTVIASGIDIGTLTLSGSEVKRVLSEATGLTLSEPKFLFDGDYVTMTLESRENYRLEPFSLSCKKKGENESGDTVRTFDSPSSYSYMMICDGMGSGERAAECSEISSLFIEKMLSAGNCKDVTLKMLSNFIRSRGEECHSTVDLFEFDRLSGEGVFLKCGAAASYILRRGNLFKIDASTMPLGITREINAEKIKMPLLDGDIIVMMSDGVAHTLEDALWVPEVIIASGDRSSEAISREIYTRAQSENGGKDDISVAVARVSRI